MSIPKNEPQDDSSDEESGDDRRNHVEGEAKLTASQRKRLRKKKNKKKLTNPESSSSSSSSPSSSSASSSSLSLSTSSSFSSSSSSSTSEPLVVTHPSRPLSIPAMTRRMAELKTKCSNMKLGPHGVEWVGELPAVLDLLLSAHAAFSRLSLLLRSRGKGEEIQDVVSGCLDILTLLGYSFSMDFSGVLEKKVAETQAVPKMLFFFNATTDDLNKKNAAAILAYFTKGAPLSAECVAIVPVLAEKCAFWCNRISSPTIPLLGYKLLLSAIYVVCLTPDGATRMVDAKIINPLLSVIAASKPPPEFTEMPSMIIATVCQNTAHSPAHVKKLVKASLYPVVVKAMGVAFVDNQHKELYQYMLAMECMLLLTMLGGFAKWNSMHGVPDPRTVVLAAHMLLCVARHGAKGRERGRGRGKEDDDVVTDTEEKTQKTEITLLKRTGTGMGIDIGTGTETGAGTNVYKALFEAGKYRSVFASLRASYYCMSVSLISGELEQCINSCIGFLE